MSTNPYYGQEGHGPYELTGIGNLELEEGGTIPDCQLAVATHGILNAARDNAILVPTWYSGTSKIMEQVYIGNGCALDPAKYFIIVVNQIGNGLSTSPHNSGGADLPEGTHWRRRSRPAQALDRKIPSEKPRAGCRWLDGRAADL